MNIKYNIPLLYDYVFPNFIIPNASPIEQTIINYIYTQYNTGVSESVFLETKLETDTSPLNMIFNKDFYDSWPTSLMHNGTRLKCHCYHDILNIEEKSMYFGKPKGKKYLYPIKISPHFKPFIGATYPGSKLNGEYFWKNMSAEALKDCRERRAYIFLDWGEENFVSKKDFEYLHESIRMSRIPREHIIFAYNSFDSKEVYESWFPEKERMLTVMNWPYAFFYNSWHYSHKPHIRMTKEAFLNTKNYMRPKHFLFRTRRARSHRLVLLAKMFNDDLLKLTDWSYLDNLPFDSFMRMVRLYQFDISEDSVRNLFKLLPHRLLFEENTNFNNVGGWTDLSPTQSISSYIDITTETLYSSVEQKSLTEKICKPLVNFQPFIFVGFPGALELLKSLGFKTFEPFINEAYDKETNEITRLHMIYEEIKKISNMNKIDLHNWYWSMEDILMHNHDTLMDFHKKDKFNHELIRYLYERTQETYEL